MRKLLKLLSPKWWIGPPIGPLAAIRAGTVDFRRRRIIQWFESEEAVARVHDLRPRVYCPVCGDKHWSFYPVRSDYDVLRFGAACPECGALERHRLIKLALDKLAFESWEGALLHFAPENCLRQILETLAGVEYSTADLLVSGVDHQVDAQNLPFEDDRWNYILCSHVLEHVADDEKALSELRRVLRPGGVLLLCVPINEEADATVEFGGPAENFLHGHWRTYGMDFEDRAAKHFEVQNRSADRLPAWKALRFGLVMSDMLLICK